MRDLRNKVRKYISDTPDKNEQKATVSRKFKQDLADFILENYPECRFIEFGTSYGHTTELLSYVCKAVTTIDNVLSHSLNIDKMKLANVTALTLDLYTNIPKVMNQLSQHGSFDVSLIDAVHTYNHSLSDAKMSIYLGCKSLIFDDVGLFESVNSAYEKVVSESLKMGIEVTTTRLGKGLGDIAHGDKKFMRSEGIVVTFPELSTDQRSELIRSLNHETPLSNESISKINSAIQNMVSRKLLELKDYVNKSGRQDMIHMFEDKEVYENTTNQFIKSTMNAIHSDLGKPVVDLPNESLPDILASIIKTEKEFGISLPGESEVAIPPSQS